MFVVADELNEFRKKVIASDFDKRLSIVEYIAADNSTYPINTLRNMAIANTNTNHFWLTDLDFWPSGSIDMGH